MPVAKLAELTPAIDWPQLFADTGVTGIADLNVANPDFFKGLEASSSPPILTPSRPICAGSLSTPIPSTPCPRRTSAEDFNFYGHELRGQPEQEARWKRCVAATDGALGEALRPGLRVHAVSRPPAKPSLSQMVRDIEDAMDKEIGTLTWMSAETKHKARAKLHMVADKIGYPDHWRDYSTLDSRPRRRASATLCEPSTSRTSANWRKSASRSIAANGSMSPPTVNAYYNPSMNDINFPAGILQSPFFDPHAPDAANYGHIGAIVGHELTHGFDDQGSQFDGDGNLSDWWTADDRQKFDAMTDCEVKEYGNFTAVDDVKSTAN